MGYNQEAYDAECAALAKALETAARRQTTPEKGHHLHRCPAGHEAHGAEEPGPGQMYAIQERKHVAALQRARPGIIIEIRWCPAHKGVPGNEMADERAKLAAEEPDADGVGWLQA
jgi:hypothetical protein